MTSSKLYLQYCNNKFDREQSRDSGTVQSRMVGVVNCRVSKRTYQLGRPGYNWLYTFCTCVYSPLTTCIPVEHLQNGI